MLKNLFLLMVVLVFSIKTLAWGPIGHRTVGLIADAHLTPAAKLGVNRLLNGATLSDVANWADIIKSGSTYTATHWYHFENIPDQTKYINNLKTMPPAQQKLGGVVQAVIASQDILRSPNFPISEKADALKFLTHFLGDLHQPLHTGRPEDKGGTTISVIWFGTKMSLHQVWDSGMILTGHRDIITPNMTLEQASLAYAQYLVKSYRGRFVYQSSTIETWLNESLGLRAQSYDQLINKDQNRYQALNLQQIDGRVLMSGLRLADTLNQIFAGTALPKQDFLFRQQIESIVGSILKLINLRP